ncbi:MAG: hypothetical protein ACE5JX_09920 [Acidobacteriota bacterium]
MTLMLTEEMTRATVRIVLLDASSGVELETLDGIEVAITEPERE